MLVQVKPWGNSQGIRLSRELLALSGITNQDFLEVEVSNGTIVLKKTVRHRTLEERAVEFDGKAGPYGEYEWGDAVGRERW